MVPVIGLVLLLAGATFAAAASARGHNDGCWVKLYRGMGFDGRMYTVQGPNDVPAFRGAFGGGGFRSAIVGPRAYVVTFGQEDFRDRTATLRPGERIVDLREQKLGLFEGIASLQVRCR